MATVATPLMTAGEFFEFVHRSENRDRLFELERGEVVEMSRPGKLHGYVCGNVRRMLGNFSFGRRKGYVCSNDTVVVECDPDTVRGPDVLFFDDGITSIEDLEVKFAQTPATLAADVLFPNDKPGKLNKRIRELVAFGTSLIWVIDPELHCVTIYRPGIGRQIQQTTLEENEEITGEEILPDFKCRVAEFFAMPGQ